MRYTTYITPLGRRPMLRKGGITPLHAGYRGNIQEKMRPTIFLFLSY